jgi:hypothetical protein
VFPSGEQIATTSLNEPLSPSLQSHCARERVVQKFYKNLSIWLLVALAALFLLHYCKKSPDRFQTIAYNDFLQKVDSGVLSKVTVVNNTISWETADGTRLKTVVPQTSDALEHLLNKKVTIHAQEPPPLSSSDFFVVFLFSKRRQPKWRRWKGDGFWQKQG